MNEPGSVGDIIADKYRVDRVLGRGGMGMVIAATHLQLQKPRAIKLMLPEARAIPGASERFLREAWTACRLESEHVGRVLDVGEHGGLPFMVMEYLDGSDLRAVLEKRGRLAVREACLYTLQVCDALAEAHALGIIHRDIKPANLFLTRRKGGVPFIKVLDFGVAKATATNSLSGRDLSTSAGFAIGSPHYMSPEQIQNQQDIDGRSDIWATGVVLHAMITGQLPFQGSGGPGMFPILSAIMERAPAPPSSLVAGLPAGLDEVILRCLQKDRSRRYRSVAELAVALSPFAPVDAVPVIARIRRVPGEGTLPPPRPSDLPPPPRLSDGPPSSGEEAVVTSATLRASMRTMPRLIGPGRSATSPGRAPASPERTRPMSPVRGATSPASAAAGVNAGPATLTSATWDGEKVAPPPPSTSKPRSKLPLVGGAGLLALAAALGVKLAPVQPAAGGAILMTASIGISPAARALSAVVSQRPAAEPSGARPGQ